MATATMATAAGAAALLYYTLNRKLQSTTHQIDNNNNNHDDDDVPLGIDRISHRLIQAPATWLETLSTLSETLRFTYSETLGRWPIGDLAFGINFLLKRQGNLHVSSVFGGEDSVQLKGPQVKEELKFLLNLLTLCWHFSKKPFPLFLEETGYSEENVLLQEPKAGILKPAFTVLVDHESKCFLLLIRGTHSIKDTLTAATGAVVPFHHSVVHEGGVSNLVLGYAHCGMVAAARWIAKLATPRLHEALRQYPDYKLKIVGHSLGGGTAALLTYILREQKDLSTATCFTFAPGACMTWELAESGNDFITCVINGADLVPTFSVASVDDLRVEVVMRRAQSMAQAAWTRPSLGLSSWSCIGPRRRAAATTYLESKEVRSSADSCSVEVDSSGPLFTSIYKCKVETDIENVEPSTSARGESEWTSEVECPVSEETSHLDNGGSHLDDGDDIPEENMNEVELWQQLEHELYNDAEGEREIREEEAAAIAEVSEAGPGTSAPYMKEVHRFFPPGKIMHIVTLYDDDKSSSSTSNSSEDGEEPEEPKVGIFLTPRMLYSKLRLSQTMISDHFMPVYRRQIEKLIKKLEEEEGIS
ncbi:hypothetical protein ACFE04_003883 [Oxalis oulophora]